MLVTLWTLPVQPVPKSDVAGSTFVTIWAFVFVAFVLVLSLQLRGWRGLKPTWPEFGNIRNATILLAIWYILTAVDRWLHYERDILPLGYILFEPLVQVLQIVSTVWYLWGTYMVLWNDLERRFTSEEKPGHWWLAAKIATFIVFLICFFFVVLNIATRIVWLEFYSLNVIADVATKRNNFEMAMTAFIVIFGSITIAAAIATFIVRANTNTGSWTKSRVCILLATVMLFARSVAELSMSVMVQTTATRRSDVRLPSDITFGMLTALYLTFMCLQANQVSRRLDGGSEVVEDIESDVRRYIIQQLRDITGREVPLFRNILDQALSEVLAIVQTGLLSVGSPLPLEEKQQVAEKYIKRLRRLQGHRGALRTPDSAAAPLNNQRSENLRDRAGRQSAPLPSSSAYESLRSNASQGNMRTAASVPDMRVQNRGAGPNTESLQPRFAPRRVDQNTTSWGWQSNLPDVQEHSVPAMSNIPSMPNMNAQGPPPPVLPLGGTVTQANLPLPPVIVHPPNRAEPSFNDRVNMDARQSRFQTQPIFRRPVPVPVPVGNRRRFEPQLMPEDDSVPEDGSSFPLRAQQLQPQPHQPVEPAELAVPTPPPATAQMALQYGGPPQRPGARRNFSAPSAPFRPADETASMPMSVLPSAQLRPVGEPMPAPLPVPMPVLPSVELTRPRRGPASAQVYPTIRNNPPMHPQYTAEVQHYGVSPQTSMHLSLLSRETRSDESMLGGPRPSYATRPSQAPPSEYGESVDSSTMSPQNWSYQLVHGGSAEGSSSREQIPPSGEPPSGSG